VARNVFAMMQGISKHMIVDLGIAIEGTQVNVNIVVMMMMERMMMWRVIIMMMIIYDVDHHTDDDGDDHHAHTVYVSYLLYMHYLYTYDVMIRMMSCPKLFSAIPGSIK
jgi:hypothetical protein